MKTRSICVAGLFVALTLAAWSAALGAQAGETPARAGLRERINDLYLLRLTRALDLTEDQTARIYPLLIKSEKLKASLQRQMGLDLRDLREELAKTPPGEKTVLGLVDRIRRSRRAIRQKDDEVEAALDSILSPVQRARHLIFNVEFLRNVGESMGRTRGARAPVKRTP